MTNGGDGASKQLPTARASNPYIRSIMAIPKSSSPAGRTVAKGDHVYLIDGSGYIFRAYHALPPLTRPSDGLPVGAVHGFCAMLWKLLRETGELAPPTHIAVILDYSAKTFRSDLFDGYKANRPEPPGDLIPQFPLVRDAVRAFNVACIEMEGYEADDLIATYAREATEAGAEVTIVSSDKDLMQIVGPGVLMYDTMKNKAIGEPEVIERFGVPPSKVIEVQALIGDSTDNVPGVPGIGVKTAALLINEFGDLETLLARASEIKQDKRRENLIQFADQARLSKTLVILDTHVPLDVPLAETAVRQPDAEALTAFMRKLEFTTLLRRVAEGLGAELPEGMTPSATPQRKKKDDYDHPLRRSPRGEFVAARPSGELVKSAASSPAQLAVARAGTLEAIPFDRANYETVTEVSRLADLLDAARYQGHFAFRVKLTSSDPMRGEIAGIALALVPGHAAYVPLAHRASDGLDLGGETVAQIPMRAALGPAEADPRGRERPEDRAERQVRHGGARPLRHRASDHRRSLPDLLRARRRPRRASARPARRQSARLYLSHRERGGRNRPCRRQLRSRAHRFRHRICRRGDRHRLAALARAQAAPRRRIRDHGLRDARAAARAGAGRDGARRCQGRAGDARHAVRLVRPDHRPARGRDQGFGRRGLQYRLAQAARGNSISTR